MIGLNGASMAGKSSKGSMRLLDLRGRVWWFKKAIPADCQKAFGGRGTYLVNLRTSDVRVAQQRRDELDAECVEYFRQVRSGAKTTGRSAREWGQLYRDALQSMSEDQQRPGDREESDYSLTMASAEQHAEQYGEQERREFEDAFGGREPVEKHLAAFLKAKSLAPKTTNERRGLVNRFAQWCAAEGLKLPDIDRRTVGRYVEDVIQPMHPRTAKKHLTALRGYWEYLRRRGHVGGKEKRDNPWNDQYETPKGTNGSAKGRKTEREFTADEVRALLYGAPKNGKGSKFDDVTRQVTLIGLLSGMRQGEIVTLQVGDIVEDAGDGFGKVFDLKASKTEAGVRRVPVHPDLNKLIDALVVGEDGQRRPDSDWLFAEFSAMANPGDTFGKRFRLYRETRGVDDKQEGQRRSKVNFHSTRRWFVTEAERAGQPETTVALVVGHETEKREDITFGVYSGGASGAQRRACVEAVKLPEPLT